MSTIEIVYRPNNSKELFIALTHLDRDELELLRRKVGSVLADQTPFRTSFSRNGLDLLGDERTLQLFEIKKPLVFLSVLLGVGKKDPLRNKWHSLAQQFQGNVDSCQWWIRVMVDTKVEEKPLEIIHHGDVRTQEIPPAVNFNDQVGFEYEVVRSPLDNADFDARNSLFLTSFNEISLSPVEADPNDDTQVIEFDDDHANETTKVLEEINVELTDGNVSLLDEEIVLSEMVEVSIADTIDQFDFLFAQAFEWDGGAEIILGV